MNATKWAALLFLSALVAIGLLVARPQSNAPALNPTSEAAPPAPQFQTASAPAAPPLASTGAAAADALAPEGISSLVASAGPPAALHSPPAHSGESLPPAAQRADAPSTDWLHPKDFARVKRYVRETDEALASYRRKLANSKDERESSMLEEMIAYTEPYNRHWRELAAEMEVKAKEAARPTLH